MDNNGSIRDDEVLYRSVRGKLEDGEYFFDRGKLRIRPAAFRDRYKKPSVDRAKLKGFDPYLSRLDKTDGVVSLIVSGVRSIREVKTEIKDEDVVVHTVNIVYDPTPTNPAHSQIVVSPEFFGSKNKQKNVFKLLQIALATLATENGWTVEPSM